MQTVNIGQTPLEGSRLAYGCMRIAGDGADPAHGRVALEAALDAGYTVFDHADIYGRGASETLFGDLLAASPSLRDEVTIIGKCGVRFAGAPRADSPARYDLSAAHIERSVEGSLERLGTDRLDVLLLHRPDYLMQPEEVAGVFERLERTGKVRYFGVSNFSPPQVALFDDLLPMRLCVNQVEINIHNIDALADGTLDQCLRLGLTPQAWCPVAGVAYPAWGNRFEDADAQRIREELARQSALYEVEPVQIVLAWLLAHPSGIMPIIGTTTPARIAAAVGSLAVDYARDDWYRLLEARNGAPVP